MKSLAKVRESLGFSSQNQFAKALGVDSSYINRLESNKQKISKEFLDKVCATFPQVNRAFLTDGLGEPIAEPKAEPDSEIAMRVIAERVQLLDPDLQAEVYELCRRILNSAPAAPPAKKTADRDKVHRNN
ncbi:MAG: helix-turn-helix transcriptional regulator [Thermoguttaceae bacterium]|nr:helix-turn-helix transcriptional regulator [Thermoguttaceae bacterium]